jgi:cation transport ATPase
LSGAIKRGDTAREEAAAAIRELRRLGIRTVLLMGDVSSVAKAVPAEVGIDDVQPELLADEKVAAPGW